MAFTHLHVHTEYSALDGMIRIGEAFRVAKDMGQEALAVTDHGTLGAMWAAQKEADSAGVKLIPGIELYLANGDRHSKHPFQVPDTDNSADEDSERGDDDAKFLTDTDLGIKQRAYQHLTLIATTPEGWRNMVRVNNESQKTIWRKPRADFQLIADNADGLIILTGCLGGPLIGPLAHARQWEIQADDTVARAAGAGEEASAAAEAAATRLRDLATRSRQSARENLEAMIAAVGRENVYVEIMDHGIAEESVIIPQVVDLAREYGLPLVATNDAHHTHEHEQESHSAWLLVQSKSTIQNPTYQFHGSGYWLKTEDEMRAVRPEPWWQEACDNTSLVADRVAQRTLPHKQDLLPRFPTPEGYASNREYMFHLLREGADRIYGGVSPELHERVMTEMEVIEGAGYVDYFLVVHELVSWCHQNGILTGPGRGSAAGAMVTYLMNITRVDPLMYDLLFERFLEKGRQEPPDIDIDFPQGRRDDVIQHLRDTWGADNVSFIGTYGIARSKAALKDAARVLGEPTMGNKLAALVPTVGAKPLSLAVILDPKDPNAGAAAKYRDLVAKDEVAKRIHDMAASFENVVKGVGIHASGVIVSAQPLGDLVPLRRTARGWAMQWTGPEAEDVGLLKVDVLGLRNLDVISKAVEYIEQTTGEVLDPLNPPDPDRPPESEVDRVRGAFRVISEGRTAGLFQLESPKMTELAMEVAPRNLGDLSALVALFRPGPMGAGLHTEYASRKRRPETVSYRDYTTDPAEQAALERVLGDTFGLMTYQEQVMLLGTTVAGFDAGMRSKLRKAVSKKKADVMKAVGEKFFEGAPLEHRDEAGSIISIPFSETTARALWDAMVSFAAYAFNKSHSATYGYLAYVTAYLKANWPAEYAAATLAVTSSDEKRIQILRGLDREGIRVLAPDVNAGNAETEPAGDHTIRIGLSEAKGVSQAGFAIAAERTKSGQPFTSVADVRHRVVNEDGRAAVNASALRAIIESGAADEFGTRLGQLLVLGTTDVNPVPVPDVEWPILERATRQRLSLLLPIGTHPLEELRARIEGHRNIGRTSPGRPWYYPHEVPDEDHKYVNVVGILAAWDERAYSRGRMANILLEDEELSISGTMWDEELRELENTVSGIPNVGDVVQLTGRIRYRTIEPDEDDEDAVPQVLKELTVNSLVALRSADHAPRVWGISDVTVPSFVPGPPEANPAPDPEPDVPAEEALFEMNDVEEPPAAEPVAEPIEQLTVDDPAIVAIEEMSPPVAADITAAIPVSSWGEAMNHIPSHDRPSLQLEVSKKIKAARLANDGAPFIVAGLSFVYAAKQIVVSEIMKARVAVEEERDAQAQAMAAWMRNPAVQEEMASAGSRVG